MAVQHGVAGEWARVRGTVLSLWPLFLSFMLTGAFLAAMFMGSCVWVFGLLFVASLISMLMYWKKGLRRIESFFRGARGEERVAGLLATLPDAYHVFNDFEAGAARVDHVVAGPAGVFAVETKSWKGAVSVVEGHILVNGALPSRDPVAQCRHEADKVCSVLRRLGFEMSVVPVVCFASDTFSPSVDLSGPVKILNSNAMGDWFGSLPEIVPPDEVTRLVRLLESGK